MQNDMVSREEMTFQDLHEALRIELLRRIEHGALTRTALARQAAFRQAHISNYLNRRRSLSLDGLDRVMAAQGITIDQLMPLELAAAATPTDSVEVIPVVSPATAMDEPVVRPGSIIETIPIAESRLPDGRPSRRRAGWQRFVGLRVDEQQAAAMDPLLPAGATVLLDRHADSLAPYRAHQRTLYAARCGATLLLRYAELDAGRLILRPLSLAFPVQLLSLAPHETPADYIVGRVCLVLSEL